MTLLLTIPLNNMIPHDASAPPPPHPIIDIFSVIKKFRNNPKFVLPDRADIGMTVPFMDAYVRLLIKTCHRRGVHAMGGMAAQIPIRDDPAANKTAMEKVRKDKLREVQAGHDGTWVAHPALVTLAKEIFDQYMPGPNQLYVRREDVKVTAHDLLNTNLKGAITEKGIRINVSIALQYMEAWLRGSGCVPIHHLMEDAATAEISVGFDFEFATRPFTHSPSYLPTHILTQITLTAR